MDLDWSFMRLAFDVLQFAATVAVAIYVWLTSRHRVTNTRITNLAESTEQQIEEIERMGEHRFDKLERRVTRIERDVRHLPTHNDIKALSSRITEVHGDLENLVGQVKGLNHNVGLVLQHLVNSGRGNA